MKFLFELAVYMQFVFVTATSIIILTSGTQEIAYTVSEPQEEKQSKNLTFCGPALMADLDLEKQHGKVIQRRAGGNNKLLEKGMETPSSLVIDLLTSISNCYYCREIHKEGCQSSP